MWFARDYRTITLQTGSESGSCGSDGRRSFAENAFSGLLLAPQMYIPEFDWSRREDLNTPSADWYSAALPLSYTGLEKDYKEIR